VTPFILCRILVLSEQYMIFYLNIPPIKMKTASHHMLAVFTALSLAGVPLGTSARCLGKTESVGCTITPLPSPRGTPVTGICQGTSASERIVAPARGCNGGCVISGGGGADRIIGSAGADFICGGSGADIITAGNGNDAVAGGAGRDSLFGENGADILVGDEGNDLLDGGRGSNVIDGKAGYDVCLSAVITTDC
jgi:Ca2+-binding RTX toxin-like protein